MKDRLVTINNTEHKDILVYVLGRYYQAWDKVLITNVGLYSLTQISESEVIFKCVANDIKRAGYRLTDFLFIDGCAGMGFDTFVMSYYTDVLANELTPLHLKCIKQNLKVLTRQAKENCFKFFLHDIRLMSFDVTRLDSLAAEIEQYDNKRKIMLYLDPPFGGKDYSNADNIRLTIGEMSLLEFVQKAFSLLTNLQLIVLKLPFNYDLTEFTEKYQSVKIISLAKLTIMFIWSQSIK